MVRGGIFVFILGVIGQVLSVLGVTGERRAMPELALVDE